MLRVRHYNGDPIAFRDRVLPKLLEAEAENCRLIAHAIDYAEQPADGYSNSRRLWTVESARGVELVAVQKSATLIEISRGSDEAVESLVDSLIADGGTTAIVAPKPTIEVISSIYAHWAKMKRKLHRRFRGHVLTEVLPPLHVTGSFRCCDEADRQILCEFIDEYMICIGESAYANSGTVADELITAGRIFFWCDAAPVAMAAWAGPTPNGIRVNMVYTRAEYRNRHYASNLVAALSQKLLDEGRRSCFLFTDRTNAGAEHVYQQIGYQPVSDGEHWVFDQKAK